jgi:RNA polymerase sigma factor (sigma-70 family)
MDDSLTSVSLLLRIRANRRDEAAWREFAQRYGARIYRWCENRRLQPSDAEDVTQEVLLKLAKHFEKFEYDRTLSFRGWLRRVTENAIKDYLRSRSAREQGQGGTSAVNLMADEAARTELTDYLAEAFDLELFDEAKRRVQLRVNHKRWQSWELLCNHAMSGKQVAQQLGISAAVAYANKNQIQKLIREEIEALEMGPVAN